MFFLSKTVTDRIKSLGENDDVKRQVDVIKGVPGYEVYANAIAEGVRDKVGRSEKPVPAGRARKGAHKG